MSKKQPRNTKGKIISAAWKLFYEQGYDDTTIDEIVAESGTSKVLFIIILRKRCPAWLPFFPF
ncbi:MAG: TetR/AcrR family transcriptional regulator [Eubacterium ramulus]